ncbi:Foldase protein PrsA [bioreactor metagenome]|uniref:Foldase protein PrsA n=1 Tax=bioreactor metagenome TaxID=1076179 RepID=A0A644WYP3_9ZZZZ
MKKFATLLALMLAISSLGGCSNTGFPTKPAATMGDAKVSAESFYYYFSNVASSLETDKNQAFADLADTIYDETAAEPKTYRQICEESAIDGSMVEAIIDVLFNEAGLTVEPADEESVKQQVDSYITQFGSEEDYEKAITDAGMSRSFFENSLLTYVKIDKLTESLRGTEGFTDDDLFALMSDSFVRVKHILLKTTDDDGNALDDAAVKAKADALVAQLDAGADFDTLMAENGEDPGMTTYPDGYVIDQQISFDPVFLTAAFELAEGEYTLVKGSYGYHIIKRLPLEKSNLDLVYPDGSGATVKDVIFYDNANQALIDKVTAYKEGKETVRDEAVIDKMVKKYSTDNPFTPALDTDTGDGNTEDTTGDGNTGNTENTEGEKSGS